MLKADGTLSGLVTGIYDNVPDETAEPYITIPDSKFEDSSSHTHDGFKGSITINVWSVSRGTLETKTIQNRLYELLQNLDLELAGFNTLNFRLGLNEVLKDVDGRTHHGVTRFDFLLGGN